MEEIKTATEAEQIMAILSDVLKEKLFVTGRLAGPIFRDSLRTGVLDPIAAVSVLYNEQKAIAWVVRTTEDWRTTVDDSKPRTENEIWWRFTSPEYRNQGFCTLLKQNLDNITR